MSGELVGTEVNVDPTEDMMIDFLIEKDKEEPYVDFKETLSIDKNAPFAKVAKDLFAFSNYGGGFILIGFKENKERRSSDEEAKRNFELAGLPPDFHIDQADLQSKFNSYSDHPLELRYREFYRNAAGESRKFAMLYIPAAPKVLKPIKTGTYVDGKGKQKRAFDIDQILFRRGTQSVPANKEEIKWIEKRAQKESYRISVLSGQQDDVNETIYCNLFEVIKKPTQLWVADEIDVLSHAVSSTKQSRYVPYVTWNHKLISFEDLSNPNGSISHKVKHTTAQRENLDEWLKDPDKERLVIYLLNKEIISVAIQNGMSYDRTKHKLYYQCDGDDRKIKWTSRFRTSVTRTVAKRMYAQQLHRFIYWHVAVIPKFIYFDGRLFLRLSQSMILTEDGKITIFGAVEGTVITRLTYNKYNDSYLNSMLFWISRFSNGKDHVSLAGDKIRISAKPVEAKMSVGIISDRPASESLEEVSLTV